MSASRYLAFDVGASSGRAFAGTLADAGGDGPEGLCDLLLEATAGTAQDDDIALLAMQT